MKGVRLYDDTGLVGTLYSGELRIDTILGKARWSWTPDKIKMPKAENFVGIWRKGGGKK